MCVDLQSCVDWMCRMKTPGRALAFVVAILLVSLAHGEVKHCLRLSRQVAKPDGCVWVEKWEEVRHAKQRCIR